MYRRFLASRAMRSWLILGLATLASFGMGVDHGTGALVVVVVLGIAAAKVRLIGLDFMEVRHAPLGLRVAFEAYCVALWAVLSGVYLFV